MPEPGLVLVGLSGGGKSRVGRLVAERAGRPFVDTDARIAESAGMPAHALLAERGEAAFREVERDAVERAAAVPGAVIATGGGAVEDPLNRWRLWHHGRVAWLDAPPERLAARLHGDDVPRPLLADDPAGALAALGDRRAPAYRAADARVDADAPIGTVAARLLAALDEPAPAERRLWDAELPRHHPLGPSTGRVVLGRRIGAATLRAAIGSDAPAVVVDRRVAERHPALLAALPSGRCRTISAGERAKSMRRLAELLAWLADGATERGVPLVAVGGGTVGDLAGTAAALYARGLPLVHLPTTWLAQADSAHGGKVAVDLAAAKNAAGAFWPAAAVVADLDLLATLPAARRRDGMAECLKAGLIGDPTLWRLVTSRGRAALRDDPEARHAIVERAMRLKLAVVEHDPYERGERRLLNLGHTLGHALEAESGYRLAHGAAVALGLRAVAAIAAGRGADPDLAPEIDAVLGDLGFASRRAFDPRVVRGLLAHDKKRAGGRQRWLLPMAVGRVVEVDDVTDLELDRGLRAIGADA